MECYNCGASLTASDYCVKCGADVKIYRKLISASNSFYNEGLEQANVRNLSGAIESLKKSLHLNKMNIDARNLLGLVYFEMGETVAALSEWVISRSYQSRDNVAGKYLNEIQSNPSRLETVNQTIKKYNQALAYCRQDSKDLATIQLKKVLSLNPKLVKGHQLLALLYMQEGRYDLANKALRQAARIDENNTTTLRYQKEVNKQLKETHTKKQKKEELISYQSGNDTVIMPTQFKDNSPFQTIINIVIGIALGIAVTIFLLLPNMKQQSKSEANEALKAANDTISTKEQSISSLENEVEDLTKQAAEAKKVSEGAESKLSSYEQLLNAYAAYAADDIEAAGAALEKVDAKDLSGRAKTIFDSVNSMVNEKYLETLYQEGYSAYSKGDYKEAIEKLGKIAEMNDTYKDGYTVYYLAQSYRRDNNMAQAVVYYQKVLEQCPGTERARVAKTYVDANAPAADTQGAANGEQGDQHPDAGGQPNGGQPTGAEGQQPNEGQPAGAEGQQPNEGQPAGAEGQQY